VHWCGWPHNPPCAISGEPASHPHWVKPLSPVFGSLVGSPQRRRDRLDLQDRLKCRTPARSITRLRQREFRRVLAHVPDAHDLDHEPGFVDAVVDLARPCLRPGTHAKTRRARRNTMIGSSRPSRLRVSSGF
jgi:hypothetical protein